MPDPNSQKTLSVYGQLALGAYLFLGIMGLTYATAKLWQPVPVAPSSGQPPPDKTPASDSNKEDSGKTGKSNGASKAPETKAAGTKGEKGESTTAPTAAGKDANKADQQSQPVQPPRNRGDQPKPSNDQQLPSREVRLFWGASIFFITPEVRLLLLVLVIGALGGSVHAANSFVAFAGNEKLYCSWIWWYLLRAPTSSSLALIAYVAVRAGFATLGGGSPASGGGSPVSGTDYAISAMAGMVGLFSEKAVDWLAQLFDTVFPTKEKGGRLENKVPSLSTVTPTLIPHGSADTTITVTGNDLINKSEVRWAGTALATQFVSATQLTATVPAANLIAAGAFDVTVFSPTPGGGTSVAVKVTVS